MPKTKKHSWGFDTKDLDTRIRPQDDFYHHVNDTWIKNNPIPPHESRWGSFLKLRHDTNKQLHALVTELATKKTLPTGSPERMIHDFYLSGMDTKRRNTLGVTPLDALRKKIQKVSTQEELIKVIAYLHTIGVGGVWGALVDQDAKDSEHYIMHLAQDGLGLPDRDYYLKKDAESTRVRSAYEQHVEALFRLMGRSKDEAARDTQTLLSIETKLAKVSMRKEDTRDSEKTYHKKSFSELKKLAPHAHWDVYFAGIHTNAPRKVIVMQPDFFAAVNSLLETVPLADWQTYLEWHVVNDYSAVLSQAFVRQNFAFYGKVLAGLKKMRPLWQRVLGVVNGELGELLGQAYVKRHFSEEAKQKMLELVEYLFEAYEARIKNLEWMSPATKKKAVHKLRAMTRKIGYPDKWKSYKGLVIHNDDYVGNVMRSTLFMHKREMKKLGKPIDHTEWLLYPQTINAYYSFGMNEIVFPAAILQPPFFSTQFDAAVNYGAIGAVIGHEITHSFDDQGSKFDAKGNMKNWWTTEDRKRFEKRTTVLKKQFDKYVVADGLKVNGQLTLGENVADLGGASIAFDAYQLHCAKNSREDNIGGFTPEQRFFLAFALFERESTRPEFQKMQVLTDPHSPGVFRVNGPASNLPEFYEAFSVKKGDNLYRAPKDRAKIW
ncbi:MAG: hypothetical protein B7X04_01100 [Parcubacteria group bacterium 21-54-25]|nr:MAG: hypothetical protein B7X04_01100 [Parcubacteria group bacterium 21-54-25]HQU07830.1 M13 family metallopeptidase [Candidatus Paceibacterota bacterium]